MIWGIVILVIVVVASLCLVFPDAIRDTVLCVAELIGGIIEALFD